MTMTSVTFITFDHFDLDLYDDHQELVREKRTIREALKYMFDE